MRPIIQKYSPDTRQSRIAQYNVSPTLSSLVVFSGSTRSVASLFFNKAKTEIAESWFTIQFGKP